MIAAFNAASYLPTLMACLAGQIQKPNEIIVINDGSTDETTAVLTRSAFFESIRLVNLPRNVGLARARNLGVEQSSSDYVMFVDADDLLTPDHVLVHHSALATWPDAVLTNACSWFEDSNQIFDYPKPQLMNNHWLALAVRRSNCLFGASTFRKSTFLALDGYREDLVEDWDLWIRFLNNGYRVRDSGRMTYFYRRRTGSLMTSPSIKLRQMNTIRAHQISSTSRLHRWAAMTAERRLRSSESFEFARVAIGSGNLQGAWSHALRSLRWASLRTRAARIVHLASLSASRCRARD